MADKTISEYDAAVGIDAANDYMLIEPSGNTVYKKINRNTLLGLASAPIGTSDSQTLTNKALTAPTISSPVLSGTVTGTYTIGGTPTFPSSVVTLTGSQTLTNKALTSPAITGGTYANGTITVDSIAEYTSTNGVTVDGLNIKDGALNTNNSVVTANITASAVTSTKINFGGGGAGVWWEEIGRTTLGSAADTISVTPIAARRYLEILAHLNPTGGTISAALRFNNDTGNNYSYRSSTNGGADATTTSGSSVFAGTANENLYIEYRAINVATYEKQVTAYFNFRGTAGAAAAPGRIELAGKWVNTANQITRVDIVNTGAGDYDTGSEVIVLGHD